MNLQHLRYALEIDRVGSISQAAKNLNAAQPNVSRAVKELETQLGITLFERTGKGMAATPEGECFLRGGERVLRDLDELERMFLEGGSERTFFSASVPTGEYISRAFALFSKLMPDGVPFRLSLRETNAEGVLDALTSGRDRTGVLRCLSRYDGYYRDACERNRLIARASVSFSPVLLCGRDSPLAKLDAARDGDTRGFAEIVLGDALLPRSEQGGGAAGSVVSVSDRASAFALLTANPSLYLWSPPLADPSAYGLAQRPVAEGAAVYTDTLLYPEGYRPSAADNLFARLFSEEGRRCTEAGRQGAGTA